MPFINIPENSCFKHPTKVQLVELQNLINFLGKPGQIKIMNPIFYNCQQMIYRPQNIIDLPNPYQGGNIMQRERQRNDKRKQFLCLFYTFLAVVPFLDKLGSIGFFVKDVNQTQSTNRYYIIQIVSWSLLCTVGWVWACACSSKLKHGCIISLTSIFNGSNLVMLIINGDCPYFIDRNHDRQLQQKYEEFELKYSAMALIIDDIPSLTYQFLVIRDNGGANDPMDIMIIVVTILNILLFVGKAVKRRYCGKNRVANQERPQPQTQPQPQPQPQINPHDQSINDLNTIIKESQKPKNVKLSPLPLQTAQKNTNKKIEQKNQREPEIRNKNTIKPQKKTEIKQQQGEREYRFNPYHTGIYEMNGQQFRATTNPYLGNDIFRVQQQMQMHQTQARGPMTGRSAEQRGYQTALRGMMSYF